MDRIIPQKSIISVLNVCFFQFFLFFKTIQLTFLSQQDY